LDAFLNLLCRQYAPHMIQLKEVAVSLQDHSLFNSLTFRFESGVSYLIEGKNGAGKTTLLKLIAGKIQSSKGSVQYDFINDALKWDEKYELRKNNIHYVPAHALHELVNGPDLFYQQRYYTIEDSPMPVVKDFFGERLLNLARLQLPESFNIHHMLDLQLPRLSNGQFKKIIILKQLLDSLPKVLLLDYPFEGLDLQSRIELSEFLNHLAIKYKIQLIIADHEHSQLPPVITKKIVLDNKCVTITSREVEMLPHQNNSSYPPALISQEMEPVLEMRDLKIQYGDQVILKNLNWKINRGERWALTGRNGSGKTTLFSLIYADHPMAYSEQVYLFGKRRGTGESIWDIKKRISYLGPEQLHFLDHSTLSLTVLNFLTGKNESGKGNVHETIRFFNVEDLLTKKLQELSNGQLQLVLLISLFLSQKELLLLDEPFQFLDPAQKERVNEYLESHLKASVTLILITHYEKDVEKWTNQRLRL
jgi:molybdate transport system ATP-binding protein